MVRKCMRFDLEPLTFQRLEKTIRVADAGNGMDRFTVEGFDGAFHAALAQIGDASRLKLHDQAIGLALAITNDEIDRSQTLDRFAQGASGKEVTVAEAPASIHDGNLDIASEFMVLQAVIGNDHIDVVAIDQGIGGIHTAGEDRDGATGLARHHDRFVACEARRGIERHIQGATWGDAPVTATDDAGS